MKITFLGTSHGAPEKGRYCTSSLIELGGMYYIIDLGAPVEYLLKNRGIAMSSVKGVFITHMHADHVDSIASITKYYASYNREAEADIFLSEAAAIEPYIAWMNALHINVPSRLSVNAAEEGLIYNKNGLTVSAVRTEHIGRDIPSFAYIVEGEGKRVLFTGDLYCDFHDFPKAAYEQEFDLVVSEFTHCPVERACKIFEGVRTKNMIFSHVLPANVEQLDKKNIKFTFPHSVAYDGYTVEV